MTDAFKTRYGIVDTIDFSKLRAADTMISLGRRQNTGILNVRVLKSRRLNGSPIKFQFDWDKKPVFTPLPTLRELCTAFDLDLGHQVLDFVYGRAYRPMDAGAIYCPYMPLYTSAATPPLTIKSVLTPHINTVCQQLPELLRRILSLSLS